MRFLLPFRSSRCGATSLLLRRFCLSRSVVLLKGQETLESYLGQQERGGSVVGGGKKAAKLDGGSGGGGGKDKEEGWFDEVENVAV